MVGARRRLAIGVITGVVLGIILGIFTAFTGIEIPASAWAIMVVVGVIGAVFNNYYRLFVIPVRHMFTGQYDKALKVYTNILANKNANKTLRILATLNMSNIYGRRGEFDESLTYLRTLDQETLNPPYKALYLGLYGANLLMMGQDIDEAERYLHEAHELLPMSSHYLELSYLYILKDDKERAGKMIEQFMNDAEPPKNSMKIRFDHELYGAINNYYLGYYYRATGDGHRAEEYFKLASQYPYACYFKTKAIEALQVP